MTHYDVLFIHPPAIYDFRKIVHFPGPASQVSIHTTHQYIQVPIGILSVAEFLDRHGYKVLIDNLGERMLADPYFDVKEYIKRNVADVYAIELHWYLHTQGAIEVAKICKELHPESLVIIGGLTASVFHEELIKHFDFIDAVIRGESEKPLLEFMNMYENRGHISETPNVTYREDGRITVAPIMNPSANLDEFEFTRLDLLEPKGSVFTPGTSPHISMFVCRGCTYNCVTCGGSAYSYKTYFGMERPSFRSPNKLVEDLQRLTAQGVKCIGILQDPRMGGRKYWTQLLSALRKEKFDVERLTMDLFYPADEEYVKELSRIGVTMALNISPESGSYEVRKKHGRNYTNEALLATVKKCHRYHMPITVYFLLPLAPDTKESVKETWRLWGALCELDREALDKGLLKDVEERVPVGGPIMGHMVFLDPGSLGYDYPEKYGYRVLFKNIKDCIQSLSMPHWVQRINYETDSLDRDAITGFIYESMEVVISQREKYRLFDPHEIYIQRLLLNVDKTIAGEVKHIMGLKDEILKKLKLRELKSKYEEFFSNII
ncbi:MAG: radical SAM protein [Nitrososphaerota archaeon]